jgi:hypothetical protein
MPAELIHSLIVTGPYGEPEPANLPALLEAAAEDLEDLLAPGWSVRFEAASREEIAMRCLEAAVACCGKTHTDEKVKELAQEFYAWVVQTSSAEKDGR